MEFEGKKLLVLGATGNIVNIVSEAKKLGAYVVAADYYKDSPAKRIANEALLIDASDVDAIVRYCEENGVDGITTGFVDALLYPCYEACKRLGFPFYATPKMIEMSTNKTVFKQTCKKYDVPVPKTIYVGSDVHAIELQNLKYPVFVKPLDASGSRGAGVCLNPREFTMQFEKAKKWSPTNNVIVEEYITGREFLLDYIAVDGEYRLLESFDRYICEDRGSAINLANFSIAPSKFLYHEYDKINEKVISMFKQEGFTDGLIFLQGHYDGKKITFYEMGCRLGGSFPYLEQDVLGFNTMDMIVRYALSGKMVNNIETIDKRCALFDKLAVSCNLLLNGKDEVVENIVGMDFVKKIPTIVYCVEGAHEGTNYFDPRTVDIPALTIHFVEGSIRQVKENIKYINDHYNVFNKENKSMLLKKFNPEDIDY